MNCVNCGAALPPKSAVCAHCRTRNDIDLRHAFDVVRRRPDETRRCPHCDDALESLDLGLNQPLFIERCQRCLGLFFDPGELEAVVGSRVGVAARVDFQRLDSILSEETPEGTPGVRYIKCPTCRELMNRRRHGARSGVVIDECRQHGVWLDGGELRRIMAWIRAGGPIHEKHVATEQARQRARSDRFDDLTQPRRDTTGGDEIFGTGDATSVLVGVLWHLL